MLTKHCKKCDTTKPVTEFNKCSAKKDGLHSYCRLCNSANNKSWRSSNIEKAKASSKKWYDANLEKAKKQNKNWQKSNYKKVSDYNKERYQNNCEKIKANVKNWRIINPEKSKSLISKRRAAKLKATPKWLTKEQHRQIAEFYTISEMFKMYTGVAHAVDHIVPLKHDLVCGLHVPWNLTVLTAKANMEKSNKFTPGDPVVVLQY